MNDKQWFKGGVKNEVVTFPLRSILCVRKGASITLVTLLDGTHVQISEEMHQKIKEAFTEPSTINGHP